VSAQGLMIVYNVSMPCMHMLVYIKSAVRAGFNMCSCVCACMCACVCARVRRCVSRQKLQSAPTGHFKLVTGWTICHYSSC